MEKIQYYTDPLNDDFAGNNIKRREVDRSFKLVHSSIIWRIWAFLMYYVIAIPIIFTISKLYLGLKIVGKENLKSVKNSGYFLFGNHTRALDAFVPSMTAYPKKAYIIANADAVSLKGLGWLVMMLGCMPIPTQTTAIPNLMDAIDHRYKENACITIYPEAHIWPFYTGIRPFKATSFRYPVKLGAPSLPITTTYRKRRGLFRLCRRPGMTIHIGKAVYPDTSLPAKAAQKKLRDQIYEAMCRTANVPGNVEYIKYIQGTPDVESGDN